MSMETRKQIARDFLQKVATGQFDPKIFSPTFAFWSPMMGDVDKETFLEGSRNTGRIFKTPLVMTIKAMTAEGNRIAVEASSRGEFINNKAYANDYHWLFVFDDQERLTLVKEYADTIPVANDMWPLYETLK